MRDLFPIASSSPVPDDFPFGGLTYGVEIEGITKPAFASSTVLFAQITEEATGLVYDAYLTEKQDETLLDITIIEVNDCHTAQNLGVHPVYDDDWFDDEFDAVRARYTGPLPVIHPDAKTGWLPKGWELGEVALDSENVAVDYVRVAMNDAGIYSWDIVTEQSLTEWETRGFEMVSPVFSDEQGLAHLSHVCKVLDDIADVDDTCGLHIHVGIEDSDFDVDTLKRIAASWLKTETQRLTLPVYEGRTEKYSARLASDARALSEAVSTEQVIASVNPDGRRYALNFHALAAHGTVEFRGFRSTFDADEIAKNVRMVLGIVAVARAVKTVAAA